MAVAEIRVGPPCRFRCPCDRGIQRRWTRNVRDHDSSHRGSILQAAESHKFHSFALYKTLYPPEHRRGERCAPVVAGHWLHLRKNRFPKGLWLWVDSSCLDGRRLKPNEKKNAVRPAASTVSSNVIGMNAGQL